MRTIAAVVATVFGGALIAGVVPATFAQSKSAPAEQKAFVKAAVDAEKKFQSGINDKRAAEAYDERKAAICKAIGSGSFVGWIGTVAALGDAEGGRKSIEIAIWLDVSLGTGLGINSGPQPRFHAVALYGDNANSRRGNAVGFPEAGGRHRMNAHDRDCFFVCHHGGFTVDAHAGPRVNIQFAYRNCAISLFLNEGRRFLAALAS